MNQEEIVKGNEIPNLEKNKLAYKQIYFDNSAGVRDISYIWNKNGERKSLWNYVLFKTIREFSIYGIGLFLVSIFFRKMIFLYSAKFHINLNLSIRVLLFLPIILSTLLILIALRNIKIISINRFLYLLTLTKKNGEGIILKKTFENDLKYLQYDESKITKNDFSAYKILGEVSVKNNLLTENRIKNTSKLLPYINKESIFHDFDTYIFPYDQNAKDCQKLVDLALKLSKINFDFIPESIYDFVMYQFLREDIEVSEYDKAQFLYQGIKFFVNKNESLKDSYVKLIKGSSHLEGYQKELLYYL